MLKRMPFKQYLILLAKGLFVMLLMLTWSLQQVAGRWIMPVTPITIWTFLSWLLCYPNLRAKFSDLYSKNNAGMESYKTKALKLHQQDISSNHKGYRWSSNGVATNPWAYSHDSTQSTDEILNPIFIFCEHLWITFLLILCGPIVMVVLMLTNLGKSLLHKL